MEVTDVARLLRQAADAVEEASLPEVLQPVAFERALDALSMTGAPAAAAALSNPAEGGADGGTLGLVAERLGLPLDSVEQIYEDDPEGGLRLIVRRSMLPDPDQKAASMRHIALLLAVGRQAAGIEEYTPFSLMRNECAEVKVLDPSNFAAEVGKLGMRRRGSRNQQEAKANRHHIEEAGALIRTMTAKATS